MTLRLDRHQIASVLSEIATLLELSDENPFKVRAYHNAVRLLEGLDQDLGTLVEEGKVDTLPGIGPALSEKIVSLATTGKLPYYDELKAKFPSTLLDLLRVPGLGPKKVKRLYSDLDIKSLGELEYACQENRLVALPGFGAKTQEKVLEGLAYLKRTAGAFLYADVVERAETLARAISSWKEVKRAELAGSFRRRKEVVRDVDLVCSSAHPEVVMKRFLALPDVQNVLGSGDTKSSVTLTNGPQVDLRVVTDAEYPYALLHFTGSKEHNTAMRARAKAKGLKLNEYGLFRGEKLTKCSDERAIFQALGLTYIPPELREAQGEIERAEKGDLPRLVELEDVRGTFHVHSTYSDGRNSLEEMVAAAAKKGLEYVGISDHSQTASYAGGLKTADIDRQHRELDKLQKKFPKLRIFRGIESDILPDGSLDYPDKVLKKFDFVIASVHAKFSMTEEEMTGRCLKALEHPACTMLGHPTGRLLLAREGFKIDLHAILDRAAKLQKIVELNANPHRLDLDWRFLAYAKKKKVRVSINPDAHSVEGLEDVRFGVNVARKGGLTKEDVFNTRSAREVEQAFGTN